MCPFSKEIMSSDCQRFPPALMAAKMSATKKAPTSAEVGNIAGSMAHTASEQDDYSGLRNPPLQYLLGTA